MAINVTKNNFKQEVLDSPVPVLVDFWASWCGPCRMIAPIIDELSREVTNAKICKVNVDEEPELAQQFGVMSIPTLAVFSNGQLVNKAVGARPKNDILNLLSM
ncbi:MAG: thioredoxin [Clostridiales bacterium]|jgi:thioredoxin 1|nr:thioredoxin [Clostridiales bacterium]